MSIMIWNMTHVNIFFHYADFEEGFRMAAGQRSNLQYAATHVCIEVIRTNDQKCCQHVAVMGKSFNRLNLWCFTSQIVCRIILQWGKIRIMNVSNFFTKTTTYCNNQLLQNLENTKKKALQSEQLKEPIIPLNFDWWNVKNVQTLQHYK